MPIDHILIQTSIDYSIDKLVNRTHTQSEYICYLDKFIYPQLLDKLMNFIIDNDSNLNWVKVQDQEETSRLSISWVYDSPVEEVHTVMGELTNTINDIQNKNLKFLGISIWKDIYPCFIKPHVDRDVISSSIQIYLNSTNTDLSTKFDIGTDIISADYETNAGYLFNNDGKVVHWMNNEIPKNFIRYSLYAIWDTA